ncbi:hypothetical protein EST38_g14441 [Candolleomyces aberdarensis]|uniref:Uncharacterized protein n=1 Tax=Candolleomyces aberdarensis TaxID=2316362 RepID=A0A4Q2CZY1_9AGAR|nr:hypothetical protein EST38_g14441 [Candolleomyces aberdarensis]
MSGDSTLGEVPTRATRRRPQPVQWDLVFFKVEEITFPVSPHRLIENSDVLAGMFNMPTGEDQRVEGRDREHPIVLEGYQASDFDALLRVLYPTPEDLISGSFTLEKEEWVGVLNLSTRWQMKKIRDHAINNLSKISLSPVEKVVLARAHEVAKWLKEGLSEIVTENPVQALDELETLGLKTACRLLWIRDQTASRKVNAQELTVTLGSLGCYSLNCQAAMFTSPRNCNHCNRLILVDDPEAIYLYNSTSVQIYDSGTPGPGEGAAHDQLSEPEMQALLDLSDLCYELLLSVLRLWHELLKLQAPISRLTSEP